LVSELGFDGRVAVVTGAGGGIGRAYARLLAARGARVVVNDLGGGVDGQGASGAAADRVVAEIRAAGGVAIGNADSVGTAEGGRAIVQSALDEFGRLDIVINNAGILRDATLHKMTPESFESVVAVHLLGSFYVSQPAFVHMREAGYGRLVMTTSAAGLYGNFGQVNYSAAKLGLVGMAKSIAHEGAKYGIKANAIAPVAYTRMTSDLFPAEFADKLGVEKVTPLVVFLAHESNQSTGETYTVGGGRIARAFVAEGPGWVKKDELSVEDVAENWTAINAEAPYIVPANPGEQMGPLFEALK
jgi:NAD(P)-dependent dehydrogenase (short-subunit alcohol dehydrogenase family)